MPFQKLQQLLQGNQMPSPARSAMVAQLLAQNQAMPPGSKSPIESINRAAQPIIAALLARQEQKAQAQQQSRDQVNLQQMMAALQRGDTEMASGIAGSMQNNPMAQLLMQSVIQSQFGGQGEPFTLSGGQARYDAQGNLIADRPETQEPEQPDQVNIRVAGPNGTSEIFAANIDPMTGVATAKDRSYQPGEYQRVSTSIQGTPDEVFPTEGERNRALGSRNLLSLETAANDALNNNPEFDPTALFEARGDIPMVGNIMASPGFQQYRAAADEWTANMAYLRSGTTARQDEKESAFQNFWYRVGDDEQTMPFKRRLRLEAMREAYIAGARANRIGSEEASEVLSEIDRELASMQQGGTQPRIIDLNDLPE